jgi:uncharacterized protein (DUF1330 family)
VTAYVISNVAMKPGPGLDAYRQLALASIRQHGGEYLARGGRIEIVEGEWREAAVIVAFPSLEAARRWYRSAEYAAALVHRDAAVERDLVFVEGVDVGE